MTKQLTPLRRKDQATGYAQAVKDIVEWLRKDRPFYDLNPLADELERDFGKTNGPNNVASIPGESSAVDSLK